MTILMCHIVGSLNPINELRDGDPSILASSIEDGDPLDPPPSLGLSPPLQLAMIWNDLECEELTI